MKVRLNSAFEEQKDLLKIINFKLLIDIADGAELTLDEAYDLMMDDLEEKGLRDEESQTPLAFLKFILEYVNQQIFEVIR